MADVFNVGAERVFVRADNSNQVEVKNRGPGTVYYGGRDVSSSVNDGSIASGDSEDLSQAKFLVASVSSQVVVNPSGVTQEPIELVSPDYAASGSHQEVAADLNLATTAGRD